MLPEWLGVHLSSRISPAMAGGGSGTIIGRRPIRPLYQGRMTTTVFGVLCKSSYETAETDALESASGKMVATVCNGPVLRVAYAVENKRLQRDSQPGDTSITLLEYLVRWVLLLACADSCFDYISFEADWFC